MRRPVTVFALSIIGIALMGGGAVASIPHSTTGVITGCRHKSTSVLRVIDAQAGQRCTTTESVVGWNAKGATGAAGPRGAVGPQGPQGPKGDAGAPGPELPPL